MNNLILFFSVALFCFNCLAAEQNICSKVSEVKILPFNGEDVADKAYNDLVERGDESVECLIECISNIQLMPDPRQAPPYNGITVGDVALFVLMDIKSISFEEILPEELKEDFQSGGIYVYFDYVKTIENRKSIQKRVREKVLSRPNVQCSSGND